MTSFTDMPLSAGLQHRLKANSFLNPTPVQEAAIPHALEGKDVLATAQTGTGKTLAFLLPAIERLLKNAGSRNIECLILVPTRELAIQVDEQFDLLRGKKLARAAVVIGGVPEKRQIQAIRSGAQMVIATPGRLEDLMGRKLVDLRRVALLVLDEADRMLDMGFLPALRRIVAALPKERQTLCFSATLEASVSGLVNDYMRQPVRVALGSTLKPAESVELHAFEVSPAEKFGLVTQLLRDEQGRTLIFARTKRGTERLAKNLIRDGFLATMIHGDRSQAQRLKALNGFEEGHFKVLVATDVASRGIHVQDVAHVINYDLPAIPEDFIHRVGRTGRAGAKGRASTLVSSAEMLELKNIEKALKLRLERKRIDPEWMGRKSTPKGNTLASRTLLALPGEVFA